jgi:hypothetical protein
MGDTLKDGITPNMPKVRKLFPGVGQPGTPGSDAVIQVRKTVREAQPNRRKRNR